MKQNEISIQFWPNENMIADYLTWPLVGRKFLKQRSINEQQQLNPSMAISSVLKNTKICDLWDKKIMCHFLYEMWEFIVCMSVG